MGFWFWGDAPVAGCGAESGGGNKQYSDQVPELCVTWKQNETFCAAMVVTK